MEPMLDQVYGALADPTRRTILGILAEGEVNVGSLAERFPITLAGVSKHVKVLERAGLISRGRDAQWRPSRLEVAPLRDVAEWAEGYRRFWHASLDRLDGLLDTLQTPENPDGDHE